MELLSKDLVKTALQYHLQDEMEMIMLGVTVNAPDYVQFGKSRAGLILHLMEELQLVQSGYATEEMRKLEQTIKEGEQKHEYCKNCRN